MILESFWFAYVKMHEFFFLGIGICHSILILIMILSLILITQQWQWLCTTSIELYRGILDFEHFFRHCFMNSRSRSSFWSVRYFTSIFACLKNCWTYVHRDIWLWEYLAQSNVSNKIHFCIDMLEIKYWNQSNSVWTDVHSIMLMHDNLHSSFDCINALLFTDKMNQSPKIILHTQNKYRFNEIVWILRISIN